MEILQLLKLILALLAPFEPSRLLHQIGLSSLLGRSNCAVVFVSWGKLLCQRVSVFFSLSADDIGLLFPLDFLLFFGIIRFLANGKI